MVRFPQEVVIGNERAHVLTVYSTASTEQFCNTVSFPGEIYDYFCNSLSISTPQLALTTYDGETDGRVFVTTVFSDTSSDLPTTSSRSKQPTSTAVSSSHSSTATSSPSPTDSGGSPTPIGAIVGGVVGGIAVLGLIAFGIVFILRRRTSTPSPSSSHQGLASQPPETPATHQSFYVPPPGDPTKHNSTVITNGQPMTQTYPTPPPPFPAQPYPAPAPPQDMQAGYYQAADGTAPVPAGEYNTFGTAAPVSPSTTVAGHPSHQPGFGTSKGQVHEIGDGGHRGTMSELG